MSIQALNQDVRVELDGTHLKVYITRTRKKREDGLYEETTELKLDHE